MIPRKFLDVETMVGARKTSTKIPSFQVKYGETGRYSTVEFKSYDQSRDAFEGTERCVWFDEEPPIDIYTEAITRTMTGDSIVIITFTPLEGMSDVIKNFTGGGDYTEGEKGPGKVLITQTWDDVPHLSEQTKNEMLQSYPEYQRLARSKGIPELGSGAVWPVSESTFVIEPFKIPSHWKRVFALDFGWTAPTAILWCAIDTESGTHYIYAEHYFKERAPMFHAEAIKTRNKIAGFDIPGLCDPSGGGRGQHDGQQARKIYEEDFKIIMQPANNSKEAGLMKTLEMFNRGNIKVFSTCKNFLEEFRVYQRNKKGDAVGADHLCDCLRYICMSGWDIAKSGAEWEAANNPIKVEVLENWDGGGRADEWYYH